MLTNTQLYVNELLKNIITQYNKSIKRRFFDFKSLKGIPGEILTQRAEIQALDIKPDIVDIWQEGLEEASRLYANLDYTRLLIVLEQLQKYLSQVSTTQNDLDFIKNYGKSLNDAWELCLEYKTTPQIEKIKTAWDKHYLIVYKSFSDKDKKEWYTSCKEAIDFMKEKTINMMPISERDLHNLVIEHIVDELSLTEITLLLNEISKANPIFTKDIFVHVKKYIESQIMKVKNTIKGLLWRAKEANVMIVKRDNEDWHVAESEDKKELNEKVTELKNKLTNFNDIIGFMNSFRSNVKSKDVLVFKTKNVKLNEPGARCDQKGSKGMTVNILNMIVGGNEYTNELSIRRPSICIVQEFYLRLYQKNKRDGKTWFLTPAQAILKDIEKTISK